MQLDIQHVCFVVGDLEKAMERFRSYWGISPFRLLDSDHPEGIVHGENTPYKGKLAFAQAGPIEIELIEPTEGESIWREFLRTQGEGLHHLGVFVSNLDQELAMYRDKGIGVLMKGETDHVKLAYMDTRATAGVIVEILQKK